MISYDANHLVSRMLLSSLGNEDAPTGAAALRTNPVGAPQLGALDNQAAAKIVKGKIVDPDAADILADSAEIRATIESTIIAAGG